MRTAFGVVQSKVAQPLVKDQRDEPAFDADPTRARDPNSDAYSQPPTAAKKRWRSVRADLAAILVPITASRTSNLLRAICDLVRCADRAVAVLHVHGLCEAALGVNLGRCSGGRSQTH